MLIDELRDERGTAIITYYNSYFNYLKKMQEDGSDSYNPDIDGQYQYKYLVFDNLIKLHHAALNKINGFVNNNYLPTDEGSIGSTEWWLASDATNQQSNLFYSNQEEANSLNALYALNTKSDINKRSPYLLWNQYEPSLGSFNKMAWKNAPNRSSYSPTQNPFATGSNYRMGEPLEWYGNTNNLIWGKIVYNGKYVYLTELLKSTSFNNVDDTGFIDYFSSGKSIGNITSPFSVSNKWPSPFEIFRYTIFGSGENINTGNRSVYRVDNNTLMENGDTSSYWVVNECYLYYRTNLSNWALFKVLNVEVEEYYQNDNTYYETNITCDVLAGSLFTYNNVPFIRGPVLNESYKISPQGNVMYDTIWSYVYNNYYSKFKNRIDSIVSGVIDLISFLDQIINYDYTIITQESSISIGKQQTINFKNSLENWLTQFNQIISNTGGGASYGLYDSKWSNSSLDNLFNKIKELLNFNSNYSGSRTGYIGEWVENITQTQILGSYNVGSGEEWNPSLQSSSKNNSGNYGGDQLLYQYRFYFANKRVNRNDGVLFQALSSYKTFNQKLNEINLINNRLSLLTTENKYDITPTNIEVSTDNDNEIIISWDAVKASSSYDIQFKEELSGSWQNLAIAYEYHQPDGYPPDFNKNPKNEYVVKAATSGYQDFGLNFSSQDAQTGLQNNFTLYEIKLIVDNEQPVDVKVTGADSQTWSMLKAALQKSIDELSINAKVSIVNSDIRITSNTLGQQSKISILNGERNDLLFAINTTPKPAVNGTRTLKPGKAYYFRIRTNNGYQITLGDGSINSKDWNSISEWSTSNYKNDKLIHGDFGCLVWDPPGNLKVSGYRADNNLIPSYDNILLEWDLDVNAYKYRVYRSTIIDGGYSLIAETQNNYYIDENTIPGLVYYYKIQSVSTNNNRKYNGDVLGEALVSGTTSQGVRGIRLWGPLNLIASKENKDYVKLTWNNLAGANGYIVYFSNVKDGQYSYVSNDNGEEKIITDNFYIHKTQAEQYFKLKFNDLNDGVTNFTKSIRYYFTIIATDNDGNRHIREYYIKSPNSNLWKFTDIVNDMNNAISSGDNNILVKVVKFKEPTEHFRIKLESTSIGEKALVIITDGLTGETLLDVVGGVENPTPGGGLYPGMMLYYKVQAIELSGDKIVRRSEYSNIDFGERPVL